MSRLTLAQATTIVDTALATARQAGLQPLTVAVLDAGGHLVAFKREDGSGILRPQIAIGKAWGALGMGASSRALGVRLAERPTFLNALAAAAEGRLIPVPGGVLIRNGAGEVVGGGGHQRRRFRQGRGVRHCRRQSRRAGARTAGAGAQLGLGIAGARAGCAARGRAGRRWPRRRAAPPGR